MNTRLPALRCAPRGPLAALVLLVLAAAALPDTATAETYRFGNVRVLDAAAWAASTGPTARYLYGDDSAPQFADLRLPQGAAPLGGFPVIVFVHGGGWRAEWSKNYTEGLVEALTQAGFATWDLEFRRMGHLGGGYPGTFEDVGAAADFLRKVARDHPLDLSRVIAMGHSSGGHLALWLAGRPQLPATSPLYRADALPFAGVVSIAGVNDLALSYALGNRKDVLELLGEDSLAAADTRLAETDPARLLPLGLPQVLLIGDRDAPWRLEMTERFAERASAAGDSVTRIVVPGANHLDIVDARSGIAQTIAGEARRIIRAVEAR